MDYHKIKIGILGGGQLGRMMYEAVSKWDLDLHFMDKGMDFPVAKASPNFSLGDFTNYEDVINFGKDKDIVSIEIEGVNLEALKKLEKKGVTVHPAPNALKIIKDKGLQKMFYESNNIPSSSFSLYKDKAAILKAIKKDELTLPFVQKARTGGYDGRGVAVISNSEKLDLIMDTPSLVEDLIDIDKEIGLIVARNENGEIKYYDPVEMVFDEEANLVDYLFAPANISKEQVQHTINIAEQIVTGLNLCGMLAIEYFLDTAGNILVNEIAPRTHNSGHHTIEACITSQFEQHIRAITNMPLGDTTLIEPAVMINLLGEKGSKGPVKYKGMDECLGMKNVHIHFYGKEETKPYRKMGHCTILNHDVEKAKETAKFVKNNLIVTT